jgi:hypothetical protein
MRLTVTAQMPPLPTVRAMRTTPHQVDESSHSTPPSRTPPNDRGQPTQSTSQGPANRTAAFAGSAKPAHDHQDQQHQPSRQARNNRAAKTTPRTDQRILLTLDQVLAELGGPDGPLPRSTWHAWQRKGTGPKTIKLPNGQTRVARDDLNTWLDSLTRDPAQ